MYFQNHILIAYSTIAIAAASSLGPTAGFAAGEISESPFIVYSSDTTECAVSTGPRGLPPAGYTFLANPRDNTGSGDCKQVDFKTDNILIGYGPADTGFRNIGFYTDANCQHQSDVPNQVGSYGRTECMHPGVYGPDQIGSVRTLG